INDAPVVTDIPSQTIAEGSTFATITLDNYVSDVDNLDSEMTWTYSGNVELTVSIVNRVATIIIPNEDWYGSETITFRATDPGALWDDDAALFTVTPIQDNLPPNNPNRPSGPVSGTINVESAYTTNTTDPNNDQVYYMWDWGDGTQSSWLGPFNSGQSTQANHSWEEKGSYDIKVKAKDTNNSESNWSEPCTVYILQKAFIFGMIRNAEPSGDLTTFEPIRVRILWLSPFSISLQKTGLIIVTKNPFHGFIGGSIIFGRFYATPLTNATINPESAPVRPNNSIQAEKTVKSTDNPLTPTSSPLI
ncbi:MAG TPA: PKD domain-containing protein, partial [Candidatus Thermoplasmatota archaeon]|nr:PKD domain-containing protein [Candidatus Thermoplasmatota archaeon]